LPFENLTGDLTLDWMPLGLMALVGNALALNARLAPLPVETVAALLSDLPPTPCVFERAEVLKQQAGVHHVVHTRIELADREYRLDYRLLTLNRDSAGTLLAPDPIRLGRALAERLLGHLLPDAQERVDGFAPHDPWAMQVFARAMHAAVENNWARAATLLRVVLDLEPDYAEARRELQRAEQMLRPVTREVEAVAEA
jgi:hypothetical protein